MAKIGDFSVFDDATPPRSDAANPDGSEGSGPVGGTAPGIVLPRQVPSPYEAAAGDSPALTRGELRDLAACEAAIDNLRVAFWAAGKALHLIRDARLYRTTHTTFEDYCQDQWDMTRQQASRLILAWPLAERLSPIGDKINEAQVRELTPVQARYGDEAAVTVYETIAEIDGVRVTAATIKGAVHVLPDDDQFDAAKAAEQIRAYLTGATDDQAPPPASATETFTTETTKLRTILRRVVSRDTVRTAAQENPEQVRAVVTELRELLDEIEQGIT